MNPTLQVVNFRGNVQVGVTFLTHTPRAHPIILRLFSMVAKENQTGLTDG